MTRRHLIIALLLALVLGTTGFAYAQEIAGPNFVDADGDGVCDLAGTGACERQGSAEAYQYANQNGYRRQQLSGNAYRYGGADGEQPMEQVRQRLQDGSGSGNQYGFRAMYTWNGQNPDGQCQNFVDEDGDGVCDLMGTGQGPNFVDADGDGTCDHRAAQTAPSGGAQQRGQGFGRNRN